MDVRTAALADAIGSFAELMALDLTELARSLDARIIDGIENGQAQKFEYALELCWKVIKAALRDREGLDEASPKQVVKAWYRTGHLSEADYLGLVQAIDDRNRLSHVYDEQTFRDILARLRGHADLLQRVFQTLIP